MRFMKPLNILTAALTGLALTTILMAEPTTAPTNLIKPDPDNFQAASQEGGSVAIIKDASVDKDHPAMILNVEKVDATDWHAQVYQAGLSVTKDAKYTLSFTGKADKARNIAVFIQQLGAPYTMLSDGHAVDLTADGGSQKIELTAKETSSDAKLTFVVGQATGKITITDVSLTKAE